MVVYLGDDRTDEDAFTWLADDEIAIGVGERPHTHLIDFRLSGPRRSAGSSARFVIRAGDRERIRPHDTLFAMKVTVAHSPDSDDAFMFFGLASGAVHVDGIEVEQVLADIETLNRAAFDGQYEVTAVSFHAYAHLQDRYALLPHGASMGDKYGPILVARQAQPHRPDARRPQGRPQSRSPAR